MDGKASEPLRPLSAGTPLHRSRKLSNISVKLEKKAEAEPAPSAKPIESSQSPFLSTEAGLLRKSRKSTNVHWDSKDIATKPDNGNIAEKVKDRTIPSEHQNSFIVMEALGTARPSKAVTEHKKSFAPVRSDDSVEERQSLFSKFIARANATENPAPKTSAPKNVSNPAPNVEVVVAENSIAKSSLASKSSSSYPGSTSTTKTRTSKTGKGDSLDSGPTSGDYPKRKKKSSQGSYKTSYQAYPAFEESTKSNPDEFRKTSSSPKQDEDDCEDSQQPIITNKMGAISFKVPGRITHKTTIKIAHYPQPGNEIISVEEPPCEYPNNGECYEEVVEASPPAGNYSNNCNYATYNITDPNYVNTMAKMQYNPYGNSYYPPYGCWRY